MGAPYEFVKPAPMPISKLSLILYAKITAPLAKILLNDTWLGEEYTPAPSWKIHSK